MPSTRHMDLDRVETIASDPASVTPRIRRDAFYWSKTHVARHRDGDDEFTTLEVFRLDVAMRRMSEWRQANPANGQLVRILAIGIPAVLACWAPVIWGGVS